MLIVKGQTMTQHSVASYSFTYRPCQLYHIVLPRSLAAFLLCREVGANLQNCGALIRGAHLHLGITLPSFVGHGVMSSGGVLDRCRCALYQNFGRNVPVDLTHEFLCEIGWNLFWRTVS